MKYLKIPLDDENYYPIGILYVGNLNFANYDFSKYINKNTFDVEIKECYFYNSEEILNLNLTHDDIYYLSEFVEIERLVNKNNS